LDGWTAYGSHCVGATCGRQPVRQNTVANPGWRAVEDRPYNCLNMCLEIWALDGWTAYGSRCVGATCGRQPVRQNTVANPGWRAVEDRPYKFAPLNIAGMVLSIFVGIRPGDDNMVSANYYDSIRVFKSESRASISNSRTCSKFSSCKG
jgi:hypothetical protein